jgi:addiction module RelE/StbE family toxin
MIKIRWSRSASRDLERIFDCIAKDKPAAAQRVIQTIYDGCTGLQNFPNRGRSGRVKGRRELVFAPLPYIAVYKIKEKEELVEISRIYHGAQDWP